MDRVTSSLLGEFSDAHNLGSLKESKQFEHFSSFLVVRGEHSESFSTDDIVAGDGDDATAGSDTGIDGIAIIANGYLISDVEELEDRVANAG